jgi:hypothetical protein
MDVNPYAPTTSVALDSIPSGVGDAEFIRRKHLSHEASIQSFGFLYLLGAFFSIIYGSFLMIGGAIALTQQNALAQQNVGTLELAILAVIGFLVFAMGCLQGYAGWCMRKLNPAGKIPAIIVACFGLLGIPIGTLISIYLLYLLLSEKGRVVFSPEYRAVIEATPHVRYKTSIIAWVALILFILLVGAAILAAVLGR